MKLNKEIAYRREDTFCQGEYGKLNARLTLVTVFIAPAWATPFTFPYLTVLIDPVHLIQLVIKVNKLRFFMLMLPDDFSAFDIWRGIAGTPMTSGSKCFIPRGVDNRALKIFQCFP
jgi:hypothetical protein